MTQEQWWQASYQDLRVDKEDVAGRRIALVSLNLPAKRNAMSDAMTLSWADAMARLRTDVQLAAVVVTGSWEACR